MRKTISLLGFISLLALACATMPESISRRAPVSPAGDLVVYADVLPEGWQDWSWDTTRDFSQSGIVHAGSAAIAAQYTAAWGGLYLRASSAISTAGYTSLRFWVHGGASGGQPVKLSINFDDAHTFTFTPLANTWQLKEVPLTSLGSPSQILDLVWQENGGAARPVYYLDDIVLVANGASPTPTPSGSPVLSVNAAANRHVISPYIYGMNYADENLAQELQLPVRRWGGNLTTRYNWQYSVSNTGMDWFFENIPMGDVNAAALPDGSASDQFIEQDRRTGSASLITIPIIGWTASRRLDTHPYDCGFKISKYGPQQANDWQWDPDCGNGVSTNGTFIAGNTPSDTSTAVGMDFASAWIDHLVQRYGSAANGGVRFYALDNEPMLWNETHRDVHPQAVSYDELRDRSLSYAAAIKAVDPSALIAGPALFGWTAYFYSALDWSSGDGWWEHPQDYLAHGSTPFTAWYLQQMKTYQDAHGTRLLDYLDLHYYPQAPGVSLSPAGNAATQALRLRSTRSLWDATYADESWIADTAEGPAVRLIPRMREWVNNNYPGTKLAISEYNWGALDHINGALAQADVLGIFGREGVDLATLWDPPSTGQPGAYAFRIYRNYDGQGNKFGETSVLAASSDQERLAVYAAQRQHDSAMTIMVINKTGNSLTSPLNLSGFIPGSSAQTFRYSQANPNAIQHLADQALTASGFSASYPPNSVTLFVIPPAGPASGAQLYLPFTWR